MQGYKIFKLKAVIAGFIAGGIGGFIGGGLFSGGLSSERQVSHAQQ